MVTQTPFQWYALQTNSNCEFKVKQNLEERIKESAYKDCIKEVLVPTKTVTEVKNGKKSNRIQKFYPRYAFICMKLRDEAGNISQDLISIIRRIPGARGFIEKDGCPVVISQAEIDNIQGEVKNCEGKRNLKVAYEVNETVTIMDGPFSGMTGVIHEIDLKKSRLCVFVSMFGRSTPVDLECWQVQKVRS